MRAWASIMDWDLGGEPAHEFDHRMWRDAEQRMLELRFECSARVDPELFQAAVTQAWHGKVLSPLRVGQYAAMHVTTSEYGTPWRVEWEIPSELWTDKGAGYATTAPVYPMLVAALAAKVLVKHSSGDDLLTFTGSFTRWIRWLPGYVMQGMAPPQGRLVPYVTRLRGIGIAPPPDLVERVVRPHACDPEALCGTRLIPGGTASGPTEYLFGQNVGINDPHVWPIQSYAGEISGCIQAYCSLRFYFVHSLPQFTTTTTTTTTTTSTKILGGFS
jgi:hypothetical protein